MSGNSTLLGYPRFVYDLFKDPMFQQDVALAGYEQGFNERADVAVAAADGTDLNEFWNEIQATLAIRNAQRNRLIDQLTYRVTNVIDLVGVPSIGDFEVASEYGQPVGIRGGKRFNRGYDFEFYDLAVRFTWMFLAEADRAQLENLHNMALEADNRLVFNKVMKTIFNPTNLVGLADSNIPVNVFKFYNADGEVPPQWKTTVFNGTHTHYLVSNTASITPAALTTLEDDFYSHGYGVQTGSKLVLLVNRQEGKLIRGFKVATGALYDFLPSSNYGGGVILPLGTVVAQPDNEVPGQIGTYGPFHVVEEDYVPAGYIVGISAGGPDQLNNPVGIREHSNPSYQGLKIFPGQRSDYPLIDSFYRRGFGTGIRQRGAGIVMQIKASGSYATPAIYV